MGKELTLTEKNLQWNNTDTLISGLAAVCLAGGLLLWPVGLVGGGLSVWEISRRIKASEALKAYHWVKQSKPDLPWDEPVK